MRAILSGQAGLALLGEGDDVWAVSVETPEVRTPCRWSDAHYLLADAHDVMELPDISAERALDELEQAWRRDRALRLTLILLDREEDVDTRLLAAECVEEHFSTEKIIQYVANRLYCAPLPTSADISRAKQLAATANASRVAAFLAKLESDQPTIAGNRRAWEAIKPSAFHADAARSRFESIAVDAGAFRKLAESVNTDSVQLAWMECLNDSQINQLPGHRAVITAWIKPLQSAPKDRVDETEPQPRRTAEKEHKRGSKARRGAKPAKEPTIHQQWTRVEKEITKILTDIDEGRQTRALKFAQELVDRQKSEGNEEFAVKTLCNLAQHMKDRGLHQLQMQFARWATDDFAWDPQAQVQLADAFLSLNRLDDALDQFDETIQRFPEDAFACCGRAEVLRELGRLDEALAQFDETIQRFPSNAVACNGRAEVLRELGRLDEALAQFDETIQRFPSNAVACNGRAEVLRELGRLDEALAQFDETIQRFPSNAVACCGRAEVLRELRRLDDALAQFDETIQRFPSDAFACCGRAEVLRELGRLDEALAQFDETIQRFPSNAVACNGRAEVLRELGRLDDALAQFDATIQRFPSNAVACCGRAEVLRELGRLDDALAQFDQTLTKFPANRVAQNAKAHVLIEMKRYDEALSLLSKETPRSQPDWIDLHVRGMAYLHRGDVETAIELFQRGVRDCPYSVSVSYFRNALAVAQLSQKDYAGVASTLRDQPGEVADILRLHAESELGHREQANAAHQRLLGSQRPRVIGLRDELAAAFLVDESPVSRTAQWYQGILGREIQLVATRIAA